MDQLVNEVCQRTGLPQDQAQQAAQAVIDYLKGALPGPIGSQIDSLLGGQGGAGMSGLSGMAGQAEQALGGMGGGLGGMFGGNQGS